jgi:hypothetical protein
VSSRNLTTCTFTVFNLYFVIYRNQSVTNTCPASAPNIPVPNLLVLRTSKEFVQFRDLLKTFVTQSILQWHFLSSILNTYTVLIPFITRIGGIEASHSAPTVWVVCWLYVNWVKQGKHVLVPKRDAVKEYRWGGCKVQRILNHDTIWRWVVSYTFQPHGRHVGGFVGNVECEA